MTEYIYQRELINGTWNIDNYDRVDGEGNQIHLAKEVETSIPDKVFKLCCNGSEAKFIFTTELDANEQTTLGNTVTAHKNNT